MRRLSEMVILGTILALGEARPSRLPWKVDEYPYEQDNTLNNDFQDDTFYYVDQEFYDRDSSITNSDSNSNSDDFSGWYENSDDEDYNNNMIPNMPRDPAYNQYNFDNKPMAEFGPDDVIHDVGMFPTHVDGSRTHHVLEEEHFGNEINDIDKIDDLKQRMEEMQREMRLMQDMLALEYHSRHRLNKK